MTERMTIYDAATGAIAGHQTLKEGQDWYRGFVPLGTHYIDSDTREPVEKTEMAASIEGSRVVGIPVGTTAIVNLEKQPGTIDDGDLDMPNSPYAQTFHVTLQHPHFLAWTGEVNHEPG
jgi:hypothetical protein